MQLAEGYSGVYSNWHPPVMSWLLGISYAVRGDAWLFVLLDTLLVYGALASILWLVKIPSKLSVPTALVCIALPQLFLFPSIVWKDVLFANSMLAGFSLLAQMAARWDARDIRFVLFGFAALVLSLAALARQNGAVVLPCAAIAVALISSSRPDNGVRVGLLWGLGFLALTVILSLAGNQLLQSRAGKTLGAAEQVEDLQIYDIAGMVQQRANLPLPILEHAAPGLAKLLHKEGPALYTPAMQDPLVFTAEMRPYIFTSIQAVRKQWRQLILSQPLLYLKVRAIVFQWLFLPGHPDRCLTYTLGVLGPEKQMKSLRLAQRYDARDEWLEDNYAEPLVRTPVFSHVGYALASFLAFVFFVFRRRPADIVFAAMIAATTLYDLSYYFIGVACQYRYLLATDIAAIAALFYMSVDMSRRTSS